MAFSGPDWSDYENVVSLNKAWLGLLQKAPGLRGGLAGLSDKLHGRITHLSTEQIARLAATPFLLFSFREGDDRYWSQVLAGSVEPDLFTVTETDDVDMFVSAALGFIWQLARRNPYALRLMCGATLYWTECIAEQTFFGLLSAYRAAGDIPGIRFVHQRELWHKLLDSGVSRAEITRQAAQISALQAILTDPPERRTESWSKAARIVGAPQLCVAETNETSRR